MKGKMTGWLAAALAAAMLSGCGGGGLERSGGAPGGSFQKTTEDAYPLQTDQTITYWCDLSGHVSAHSRSLNETELAKILTRKTGVGVEFRHPAAGGAGNSKEQFNLMIASGDLPDVIETNWIDYPGGPERAIEENVILGLNDVIAMVSPNLTKFYGAHPEYQRQMETVSGQLYHYPFALGDDKLMTYIGPMIRADLLAKVGMTAPETVGEWDAVLRAFKREGVKAPLTMKLDNTNLANVSPFLAAYGLAGTFYAEDGKVKFGPYEPRFKDYMRQLAAWYQDGILDSNFMDTDAKRITALVAGGDVGAAFGSAGGDFGKWIPALREMVPSAEFMPIQYPASAKGVTPMYGQKNLPISTHGAAISGTSKNVELAARFLDYGYSDEGHMVYNFGEEGVSYVMKDGVPTYTDLVTDPEKNGGVVIGAGIGRYARASYNGPFVQDAHYLDQFYSLTEQKQALDVWPNTDTLTYKLPISLLTAEENKEYTTLIQDIDTYRQAEFYKLITGKSTDFDNYFKELKDRGIERAVEIQQAAYDRYKSRG
ncbi:MAG: extracellular solute-binding protein [Clostridiales bacterium]|jgi:putative aldouronate transport system substrate-binding protein|nr:extracellular solute-binding protein [Clostridiales bacterium]